MSTKKLHTDGRRFYNPTLNNNGDRKSFFQGMKMWLSTPKATWPKFIANTATPNIQKNVAQNQIAVTFVNHVTFLLQLPGLNILTDPVWCKRASPLKWLGPKRVREPGISLQELPPIDLVLISHNHYDHLDTETIQYIAEKFAPTFCFAMGDSRIINKLGVKQYHELDWWQSINIDSATQVTYTPMQHWSARTLFDQYRSLWGSYVIEHNGKKIFFGGDGGYCTHFKDIQQKFGDFDLSFIGIGSYEPRWFMKNMHTNPEEAVLIHQDLQSKLSIGMHFGTFQLSAEAMEQPVIDLQTAMQKHHIAPADFITLQEGETRIFVL